MKRLGAVLLAWAIMPALAASAAPVFGPPQTFATTAGNRYVALGDVDNDGNIDIVVASQGDFNPSFGEVTVLLGDGAGGFVAAAGSPFSVTDFPHGVDLGDVNGDNNLDIVTANRGTDDVGVLLGDGAGGFAAALKFAVDRLPRFVTLGDVNNDARLDIVAVNDGSRNVSVLLGDGAANPNFVEVANSPFLVQSFPVAADLGDVNNDGNADIAVVNQNNGRISLFLGDGAGDFVEAVNSPFIVGGFPADVELSDVDGDGNADMVTALDIDNTISVLLGDGAGDFAAVAGSPFAADQRPISVAVRDVNADGNVDIVSANKGASNVTVLLGDGAGGFLESPNSPFPLVAAGLINVLSMALADLNNDGMPDLATANDDPVNGTTSVLLNLTPPPPGGLVAPANGGNGVCGLFVAPGRNMPWVAGILAIFVVAIVFVRRRESA